MNISILWQDSDTLRKKATCCHSERSEESASRHAAGTKQIPRANGALGMTCWADSRLAAGAAYFVALAVLVLSLFLPAAFGRTTEAAHSSGWVVIGVEEYRALHAKAYPSDREPELAPPVEATMTRVDYDLRINGELATGQATLTIDVLKEGWVRVPVPAGLLVREARLDGKLVSLVAGGAGRSPGQLSALLSHTGRSTLLLKIALPVASSTGQESVTLPSTPSGVTRASVQLPRQGVDIHLNGGLLLDTSETGAESKWTAYAHGNEPLTFLWKRKTEDHRYTQALRMKGGLTELVGLGEDATSVTAEVRVEVTQGVAREVKLQLPENVTVNQVSGAMVADWESKAGELKVTFLEPVEGSASFVLTGEARSPRDGQIGIPLLRLLDSEKETGGVAVEVLGAGEIKEIQKEGLENADATDLGELVANRQSPSLAAFRFRAGEAKAKRALNVNIARYTPQAVLMANVEEARYDVLLTSEGKVLVEARYAVRNNQRNFLKITLPQGATLWSAALGDTPVRPGQAPDGSLLLPLEKGRSGEEAPAFEVDVVYFSRGTPWNDKGQVKMALPALDLPISRTGLRVYHPPLFRLTAEPGTFRVENYTEPESPVLSTEYVRGIGAGEGGGVGSGSGAGIGAGAGGSFSAGTAVNGAPLNGRAFTESLGLAPGTPAPSSGSVSTLQQMGRVSTIDTKQALVDEYRTKTFGSKVTGILPIRVSFPGFGPTIYLVSELTSENQSPTAELSYQKEKKGGAR